MSEITDKVALRIDAAIRGYTVAKGQRISWASLAKSIGYTPQAPTNWKKGKISFKVLEQIATFLGSDPTWLMYGSPNEEIILRSTGIGKSELTNPHAKGFNPEFNIAETDARLALKAKKFRESILGTAGVVIDGYVPFSTSGVDHILPKSIADELNVANNVLILDEEMHSKIKGARLIPVISYVQAGSFKEAIQGVQDSFVIGYTEKLGNEAFALEVKGESMSPEFKPGDKIIIDPDCQPTPGDYVIAQNGEHEATFKMYKPRGFDEQGREYFELVPLNTLYPTLDSRFQEITIIGTVVEHIRALKKRHA